MCLVQYCNADQKWETLSVVKSYSSNEMQENSAKELIERIIGTRSAEVTVKIYTGTSDAVKLTTNNGVLTIEGTSGVTVAFGLNYYLKYYCKKQLSWAGDQLGNLPKPLPSLPVEGLTLNAGVKYRYYQNVCTVSYSSVWWNWTRWEREIDWMALNGINLPLAFTGQEALWYRVYKNLGCSDSDIKHHFAGPAFLAWGRMGNINGWGGPLPDSWINDQLSLQHLILKRMKSLGMIPVLPGFAGHIPEAITQLYTVNATRLGSWSNFNCTFSCTYLLEPKDPLFNKIGKLFIEEQIKEYNGTNHIYNADTFNEMLPRSSDPDYISSTAQAVFEGMSAGDNDAIWLMQGWLFHNAPSFWLPPQAKALLTAVPKGRMIILDLFSESYPYYTTTESYYGQPFIWCMLHDFGGNMGFYGKLESVNSGPTNGLKFANTSMIGTGITPEGINQNYIMYDFMLENGYFAQPTNITSWLANFVERRYGSSDPNLNSVWQLLGATIYNDTNPGFPAKILLHGRITNRPNINVPQTPPWYTTADIYSAWGKYIKALPNIPNSPTVQYDAIDITRQAFQTCHSSLLSVVIQSYQMKDITSFTKAEKLMLDLLDDLDKILLTSEDFQMGKWIKDARAVVSSSKDQDLFEYNARAQVTTWGPSGEILDYACKEWGSLVKNYYKPRWSLFLKYIKNAIVHSEKFNDSKFVKDVLENVEIPFTHNRDKYPSSSTGSAVDLAISLYSKWSVVCR